MIRHRVLIDIEFAVDEDQFKSANLDTDATGVSDVTDETVRTAVAARLVQTDWARCGLTPQRSTVTTTSASSPGSFTQVSIPAD